MRAPAIVPACLLAVAIAAAAAAAEEHASLPSDGGTGWRIECANDGKALDCRTINRVHQRDTQQLIASVAIRLPRGVKKAFVMIELPLGIQVAENVTLQVDDKTPERYPIQTCTQTGCLVGAPATDALIGALRGGHEVKVAFRSLSSQTVTVTLPLAGFGLAYDRIK